jgi:hypothetical protein
MPGRTRHYTDAAAKQAAYRRRKQFHEAIALQEEQAHQHVVACGRVLHQQPQATAEQLALQAERKERAMLDALWALQTLIADFGYDEVYTHVLQHLRPTPRDAMERPS